MRYVVVILLFLTIDHVVVAQSRFRVMHLNVENLFDCQHDSLKEDSEFLPDGFKHWTFTRYWKKLNQIAQTIAAVGEGQLPDIISLCEVENDSVMHALTRRSALREARYRYIITESRDNRGIDVALLYLPGRFKPIGKHSISIPSDSIGMRHTRDILHITGLIPTLDTLDIFLCHFPSRSGGEKESEPHRLLAAHTLKKQIDSLQRVRPTCRILIMGDFNDQPKNRSLATILQAEAPNTNHENHKLYNLMAGKVKSLHGAKGTYRYKGIWNTLDHIILNGSLLTNSKTLQTKGDCTIMDFPFLTEPDPDFGGQRPYRTYNGPVYKGGYSDHLPICTDFHLVWTSSMQ